MKKQWMLRTLSKGWYLCCYKYWPRNLKVYPSIYSREMNKQNRYFDAPVSIKK